MTATTDAPTLVNLVSHAHFNLVGQESGTVPGQESQIKVEVQFPLGDQLILPKERRSVTSTALDLCSARTIGHVQSGVGRVDHNLCLSAPLGPVGLHPCLKGADPASGRSLRLATGEPGGSLSPGLI
jgi:aldose 1-epimerase